MPAPADIAYYKGLNLRSRSGEPVWSLFQLKAISAYEYLYSFNLFNALASDTACNNATLKHFPHNLLGDRWTDKKKKQQQQLRKEKSMRTQKEIFVRIIFRMKIFGECKCWFTLIYLTLSWKSFLPAETGAWQGVGCAYQTETNAV